MHDFLAALLAALAVTGFFVACGMIAYVLAKTPYWIEDICDWIRR